MSESDAGEAPGRRAQRDWAVSSGLSAHPVAAALRPRQREDGLDRGVILVAAAGERVREGRVEEAIAEEPLVDVKGDHLR